MPDFTGWPIRCPQCSSMDFVYKSDRTGNYRRYRCKRCEVRYSAVIKGLKSKHCMSEPKNLKMQDLTWIEVSDGGLMVQAKERMKIVEGDLLIPEEYQ